MVELFVRLCVALAFLGLGAAGKAPLDLSWKAAAAMGALAVFRWRLDRRGLKNAGVAGFFAVGESLILSFWLAEAGALGNFGFLVLAPCLYAGVQFSAPMISMAPLVACSLVAADCYVSKSGVPSSTVLMQALGVLSVSMLLGQRRAASPVAGETEPLAADERPPQILEDGVLQLRENYRKLRDAYNDLERRARRDKIVSRIGRARSFEGERFYAELCSALRELSHAEDVAVYTLAQYEQVMVVRSLTSRFPGELKDKTIEIDLAKAPAAIRERAEAAAMAVVIDRPVVNVLLMNGGRIAGMVCAIAPHPSKLEDLRKALSDAAPEAAKAIAAEQEREGGNRRVRELELLYELSSTGMGAATPSDLAGRIVRELKQTLKLDGIAISLIKKGKESVIAKDGSSARLVDCMSFAGGSGLGGWVATGTPELVLFDVRRDERCDPEQSLKRRIGSYVMIPIWTGADVVGYLGAATHLAAGIDLDEIGALRLVASELSRAFERMNGSKPGGLMTPQEFSASTAGREGSLVYLEPLRKEHMISEYGVASFEEAIRKLAHRLRARLPEGACLCRRDRGDFLAFLECDEEFARDWANEAAASASFIAISTSDATRRVPLAVRAKVARIASQSHQVSPEFVA